jgi:hypothetical protein
VSTIKFSLYRFIRTVQRDTGVTHPDKLTAEVITALADAPTEHQDAALEQAIRSSVQHTLNSMRHVRVFPGGQASSTLGGATAQPDSSRSWKVQGWRSKLEKLYPLWTDNDDWVPFGDLTIAALDQSAAYHAKLADANRAKAIEMAEWAVLLREHQVERIRQLPETVLRARLDREVAA